MRLVLPTVEQIEKEDIVLFKDIGYHARVSVIQNQHKGLDERYDE